MATKWTLAGQRAVPGSLFNAEQQEKLKGLRAEIVDDGEKSKLVHIFLGNEKILTMCAADHTAATLCANTVMWLSVELPDAHKDGGLVR